MHVLKAPRQNNLEYFLIENWMFFSRVREGKRRHKNNQLAFFEIHGDQWSLDTITWQIPTPTKLVSTHFVLHTTTLLGVLRRDESFCLIALTTKGQLISECLFGSQIFQKSNEKGHGLLWARLTNHGSIWLVINLD